MEIKGSVEDIRTGKHSGLWTLEDDTCGLGLSGRGEAYKLLTVLQ